MQLDLFNEFVSPKKPHINIPGLIYVEKYLTDSQQQELMNAVYKEVWDATMRRRVQHYGYKYDYKARAVNPSMYLGPLPEWVQGLANRLVEDKFYDNPPDQLIINEYTPGQGIANHIDCQPCFSNTIISLSLGSKCIMDLTEIRTRKKEELLLEPGSLLLLKEDARYKWMHGIVGRMSDTFNGEKLLRATRVSLTFRQVMLK